MIFYSLSLVIIMLEKIEATIHIFSSMESLTLEDGRRCLLKNTELLWLNLLWHHGVGLQKASTFHSPLRFWMCFIMYVCDNRSQSWSFCLLSMSYTQHYLHGQQWHVLVCKRDICVELLKGWITEVDKRIVTLSEKL